MVMDMRGCDFCEGNKIMLTDYGEYKVSLDGRIKIKGDLDGTDYLDIEYCPMCGRKL